MNKQDKQIFKGAPKWLRKQLTALRKNGRQFYVMAGTVQKPKYVVTTDGRHIEYLGP